MNEPIDIPHEQIIFFNVVTVVLAFSMGGAVSGTFYVYSYFWVTQIHDGTKPASIALMAMAVVLFMFALGVAWWGAYHYSSLRAKARETRRKQIEQAIAALEQRLKRDLPVAVPPPKASA